MKRYVYSTTAYILGMSKGRKELGAWIEDHTVPVMIALAQLYVFPYGCRTHWRQEVWDKFHEMKKFTHSKKLPNAQFILDNSWGVNNSEHEIENIVEFVIQKESSYEPREDIDNTKLYQIMETYFQWLSSKLSENVLILPNDVKNELDKLGLRETKGGN